MISVLYAYCPPANQFLDGLRSECSATERLICAIDRSSHPITAFSLMSRPHESFRLEPLQAAVVTTRVSS